MEIHANRCKEVVRQDMLCGKPWLLLVEIDGGDRKTDRRFFCNCSNTSSMVRRSFPPERQTITLSPSSIIPKSAIARPTWWRRRLAEVYRFRIREKCCARRWLLYWVGVESLKNENIKAGESLFYLSLQTIDRAMLNV